MALRIKTIEYGFTSVTASSFTPPDYAAHPAQLISIPERTSRTFKSVFLYQYAQQNVGAAATPTNLTASFRLFGADATTPGVQRTTVTASTMTNSGESLSFSWITDLTAYFTTNFSASYQNVSAALSGGMSVSAFSNLSSKLIITYQFEDSTVTGSNTLIKTVRIPQDGRNGSLTTALTLVDAIPRLEGFCPEANKTFRNIFFQIEGQTGTTAAVAPDPALSMSLDTEPGQPNFGINDTLISAQYYYGIWNRNNMVTSSIHWLSASVTNTATPYPSLTTVLYATYEYTPSGTTSLLNSIMLPLRPDGGIIGGSTTALKTRFATSIPIVDRGPILLMSSAVQFHYSDGAALAVDIRNGSQASRVYSIPATVRAGGCVSQRRFDGGAIGGAGMTLNRGMNTLITDVFRTGTAAGSLGTGLNGVIFLNYTSSVNGAGAESHPKTILTLLQETPPTVSTPLIIVSSSTNARGLSIPESYYYLYCHGGYLPIVWRNTAHADVFQELHCSVEANEAQLGGWRRLTTQTLVGDSETGVYPMYYCPPEGTWRNAPNLPDLKSGSLNPTQNRQYRLTGFPASAASPQGWHVTTYHSRQFAKTGSVYPNPGAGVTVRTYRDDTDELISSSSTNANGQYFVTFHDDTVDLYSETRVSAVLAGRSSLFRVTASI